MMKERRTLEWALALIDRQKSSEMNVQEFCRREQLNLATYYYWHQRLRKTPETNKILPVSIQKPDQTVVTRKGLFEITYPNGARLSIPSGCEPGLIRQLVTIF